MAKCYFLKTPILTNYVHWQQICKKNTATLNVVTKFCLSDSSVISFLAEQPDFPCVTISDSNMENFCHLPASLAQKLTKCVIKTHLTDIHRIPAIDAPFRPNRLFVSDEAMLKAIADLPADMRPEVVLIAETGDMKDGFMLSAMESLVLRYMTVPIIGVSVNFSCLSGILPDLQTIQMLAVTADKIKQLRHIPHAFLSVGGTVVYDIAKTGVLKGLVQEIRCGEGIFFGYNSSGGKAIEGLSTKTIVLAGEILEIADKDFAMQAGRSAGFTATGGHSSASKQTGIQKRAVLDFGVLAGSSQDLIPVDQSITHAGQTFDFTVVTIENKTATYKTGDYISFYTNYTSASFALMNRYISRSLLEEDSCYGK